MKRRHWFASLLGLGGLSTSAAGRKVDEAVGQDHMLPFRALGPVSKTDWGIPAVVDTNTPECNYMQVCIDRGDGEVPYENDLVQMVDTINGRALVWVMLPREPEPETTGRDIFGYKRTSNFRRADPDGPRIVHGDFRVRWKNRPAQA